MCARRCQTQIEACWKWLVCVCVVFVWLFFAGAIYFCCVCVVFCGGNIFFLEEILQEIWVHIIATTTQHILHKSVMNTSRYDEWELVQTEFARRVAQECLDTFTSGHTFFSFSTNQSKHVMAYVLCKVFHILRGSTPSIGFMSTIKKRGDMTRVCLRFFEQEGGVSLPLNI